MRPSSAAISLLLATAAVYLTSADAKTVVIPWGLKPSQVYAIRTINPKYTAPPPHAAPTKPHAAPTKPQAAPTALKKPPPPPPSKPPPPSSSVPPPPVTTKPPPPSSSLPPPVAYSPPPSGVSPPLPPPPSLPPPSPPPSPVMPPPAPVMAGRRKLLVAKYLYPYRYLVEYSKSAHTYKFKTLKIKRGTKLQFRVGLSGSKGHHGLERTSAKYRCGHPLKTYFKPALKKTYTVSLAKKGTYHFYDQTFSPVPVRNKKHKIVRYVKKQYNCQNLFISLSVVVS